MDYGTQGSRFCLNYDSGVCVVSGRCFHDSRDKDPFRFLAAAWAGHYCEPCDRWNIVHVKTEYGEYFQLSPVPCDSLNRGDPFYYAVISTAVKRGDRDRAGIPPVRRGDVENPVVQFVAAGIDGNWRTVFHPADGAVLHGEPNGDYDTGHSVAWQPEYG